MERELITCSYIEKLSLLIRTDVVYSYLNVVHFFGLVSDCENCTVDSFPNK